MKLCKLVWGVKAQVFKNKRALKKGFCVLCIPAALTLDN